MITWSSFAGVKFQLVQLGKISPYDYMGEFNFIPARQVSFSPGICLDLLTFYFTFFVSMCQSTFSFYLRRAEAITWENFILVKEKIEKGVAWVWKFQNANESINLTWFDTQYIEFWYSESFILPIYIFQLYYGLQTEAKNFDICHRQNFRFQ